MLELLYAEKLQRRKPDKAWIQQHVATPKTAWLHREPVKPFQPEIADPNRRFGQGPGIEIERSADTDHYGARILPVARHPDLLFRTAESDEKYVGLGRRDRRANLVVFCFRQSAKWR